MDDLGTLPSICDPARLAGAAFFWVGPGGTNTPLHHDTVMLFHAQIIGRKRWRFISPLETPNLYNYNSVGGNHEGLTSSRVRKVPSSSAGLLT